MNIAAAKMHRELSSWIGLSLLFLQVFPAAAQKAEVENNLKADCLFRFAQFVEWPAAAFASTNTPIVIGFLGQDYLSAKVEALVKGEIAAGRSLRVKLCKTIEEAERCQILFISRSESSSVKEILASLVGKSVLTVSDMDNFSSYGGMIRIRGQGRQIGFRINHKIAEREGLVISSKLLRLAEPFESRSEIKPQP